MAPASLTGSDLVVKRQVNRTTHAIAMKMNFRRLNHASNVSIIAVFGAAQLVKHGDGRYELRGGSAADHRDAREWISLFLHEAVVSLPAPIGEPTRLSGYARTASTAAVGWVRRLRALHPLRPGSPPRRGWGDIEEGISIDT
jgi:hypothetical protein